MDLLKASELKLDELKLDELKLDELKLDELKSLQDSPVVAELAERQEFLSFKFNSTHP
jgi:hypothetical protein